MRCSAKPCMSVWNSVDFAFHPLSNKLLDRLGNLFLVGLIALGELSPEGLFLFFLALSRTLWKARKSLSWSRHPKQLVFEQFLQHLIHYLFLHFTSSRILEKYS
jgi:hypothetical protein